MTQVFDIKPSAPLPELLEGHRWISLIGVDYSGHYSVTASGEVWTWKINPKNPVVPRQMKLNKGDRGYWQVELNKEGYRNVQRVHQLVANAFLPSPDWLSSSKWRILFKDDDKENIHVSNLEWSLAHKYPKEWHTKGEKNE